MRSIALVVFLFPVVASLLFGTLVLGEVLKEPGRNLNMWQFEGASSKIIQSESVNILGLENEYASSEKIEIQVTIKDSKFDCGDLYITIYDLNSSPKEVLTQSGYFEQCFGSKSLSLPLNDEFSESIDQPGKYEIIVKMNDKNYKNSISASENFNVQ